MFFSYQCGRMQTPIL